MNRLALAAALSRLGIPELAMTLRRCGSPWLTVLTYHRVGRPGSTSRLDDGVVDVWEDQLDRQLGFVKRWFHPIGMDELLRFAGGDERLPRNPLLVTFDDGYRDNYDVALPILLRHGVRATFFIATEYVDRRRLFWWDRVAWILKGSSRDVVELEYPRRSTLRLAGGAQPQTIVRVQRLIKDCVGLDLDRFVDGLERAAGVVLGGDEERRIADDAIMTWDQILALRRAGMDVQSHTRSHRVLQTLSPERVADELVDSRRAIERVVGERVRAIAYPVGRSLRGAPQLRQAVRDAGYELGFSNGTGVNWLPSFDPFDARRVSLDTACGEGLFRASLALPPVGY